jgi:hypothetical protein
MEFSTVGDENSRKSEKVEKLEDAMRKNEDSLRRLHDLLIEMESMTPKPQDDSTREDCSNN